MELEIPHQNAFLKFSTKNIKKKKIFQNNGMKNVLIQNRWLYSIHMYAESMYKSIKFLVFGLEIFFLVFIFYIQQVIENPLPYLCRSSF